MMKHLVFLLLVGLCSCVGQPAEPADSDESARAGALKAIKDLWVAAESGDKEAMERLLHLESGHKAEDFENLVRERKYISSEWVEFSPEVVLIEGDKATVVGELWASYPGVSEYHSTLEENWAIPLVRVNDKWKVQWWRSGQRGKEGELWPLEPLQEDE